MKFLNISRTFSKKFKVLSIFFDLLGSIVASAALVVDWDTAVGWAVVGVSVVKAKLSLGPEGVEVVVEDVSRVESIMREFEIALEKFLLAGSEIVLRRERSFFSGVLPSVLDEFSDALFTVLVSHALLAIFECFAVVVKSVLNDES